MPPENPFDRTPIFGTGHAPSPTNMLNMDFGNPMLNLGVQMMLPSLMQQFMGPHGMTAGPFAPVQNPYDQLVAQQFMLQQQQAMQRTTLQDRSSLQQFTAGAMRTFTGEPLNLAQQQQAHGMAAQAADLLPILTQILGPDVVDMLHGSRGRAVVLSQALHRTLHTSRDPVTGGQGATGESAGMIAQEVYDRLYGPSADITKMKGVSAGQAGLLYEQLQQRGVGIDSAARLPMQERMGELAKMTMSNEQINRLAENSPEIQKIIARGETPRKADYDRAEAEIKETHARIVANVTDPASVPAKDKLDAAEMTKLPGAENMLRMSDAQRITDRLKSMSGAVAAMRDIFGDAGRPNAPMKEIINGLEALTQGSFAMMSPGEMERMVRESQALAKRTGVSLGALQGLIGQAGQQGDQLGLDRGFAVQAAQGAVGFGAALRELGSLNRPSFGTMTMEEATLRDLQLRQGAASSTTSNQLSAALRLSAEKAFEPAAEGKPHEATALVEAIKLGQTEYTFGGVTKSVAMNRKQWTDIMKSAGVSEQHASAVLADRFMNQEYGLEYKTGNLARRLQSTTDIQPHLAQAYESSLQQLNGTGTIDALKAQGLDDTALRGVTRQMSRDLAKQYMAMTPEQWRDQGTLLKTTSKNVQQTIEQTVRDQGKAAGRPPEVIEQDVQKALAALGTPDADGIRPRAREIAATGYATMNRILEPKGTNAKKILMEHSAAVLDLAEARQAEDVLRAERASSSAGVGSAGPLARITDAVRDQRAGDSPMKLLMRGLGGIPDTELLKDMPQAEAYTASEMAFQNAERDGTTRLTPRGLQQQRDANQVKRAMVDGGAAAEVLRHQILERSGTTFGTQLTDANFLKAAREKIEHTKPGKEREVMERDLLYYQGAVAARDTNVLKAMQSKNFVVGANVDAPYVAKVREKGERLLTQIADIDKLPEAQRDEARKDAETQTDAFLTRTRDMTEAIRGSEGDMQQLGTGASARMSSIESKYSRLMAISQKYGGKISLARILEGGFGTPPGAREEALAILHGTDKEKGLIQEMKEVEKLKAATVLPTGDSRMTADESAEVAADVKFRNSFTPKDKKDGESDMDNVRRQMAAAVADRLAAAMPTAARDKLDRTEIAGQLERTDRVFSAQRTLESRDHVLARAKELYDIKPESPEEQEAAVNRFLTDKTLKGDDRRNQTRWKKDIAPLLGIGTITDGIDSTADLRSRTEKLTASAERVAKPLHKKESMRMTGTLKLEGLDKVLLHAMGDDNSLDHIPVENIA